MKTGEAVEERGTSQKPWYWQGLRFSCQRCGKCCGREPGFVWVTEDELERMSKFLGLRRYVFVTAYLGRAGNRWSLREKANLDCVMYDGGCRVYPVRPRQCRSFPFWEVNLSSRASWQRLGSRCPGVGRGRLYTLSEIQEILAGRADAVAAAD